MLGLISYSAHIPKLENHWFSIGRNYVGIEKTRAKGTPEKRPGNKSTRIRESMIPGEFFSPRPLASWATELSVIGFHFLVFRIQLILVSFHQFPNNFWVQFSKRHGSTLAGDRQCPVQ